MECSTPYWMLTYLSREILMNRCKRYTPFEVDHQGGWQNIHRLHQIRFCFRPVQSCCWCPDRWPGIGSCRLQAPSTLPCRSLGVSELQEEIQQDRQEWKRSKSFIQFYPFECIFCVNLSYFDHVDGIALTANESFDSFSFIVDTLEIGCLICQKLRMKL